MKQILLLLLLILSVRNADANSLDGSDFAKKLGAVVGDYRLVSKNENCRSGNLSFIKNDSGIHLKLGAKVLVANLDKEKNEFKEDGCLITSVSEIKNGGKLISTEKTVCKNQPDFVRIIAVDFQNDKFTYKIETKGSTDKVNAMKCELVKGKEVEGDSDEE